MPNLLRAAAFVLALMLPTLAWAQGSILQGGPAPVGHVPMYSGPGSSSSIVGDSGSASGTCSTGSINCGLSEFLQEDRAPGLGPFGTNSCFYDLGETHYLCLDANAAGRGLIVFGAVGNATPIPLTCIINGVTQNCLGTANIVPPVTLTDNKTGAIAPANEGAVLTALSEPGVSAEQIANWIYCNGCTSPVSYDALRGVTVDNGGQTMLLTNGVAGYVVAQSTFGTVVGGGPTSVALFGAGVVAANSAEAWGVNTILTDNKGQAISAGTGRMLNGAEFDFNITSPNTTAIGVNVQGNSLSQPLTSDGVACGPLSFSKAAILWSACLQSDDFVTTIGLLLGLQGSAGNAGAYPPALSVSVPSQLIEMNYTNAAAVEHRSVTETTIIGGNGGGSAAVVISSDNAPSLVMNLGLVSGGFFTQDSAAVTNGMIVGRAAASGSNVNSQKMLWGYFDNAAVPQSIFAQALGGTFPVLALGSSSGGTPSIQLGASLGVSCGPGTPSSSFASVGGIITHC